MIRLDFESRSKADIEEVGSWRYSIDPTTRILCMSYEEVEGETKLWVPPSFKEAWEEALPKLRIEAEKAIITLEAKREGLTLDKKAVRTRASKAWAKEKTYYIKSLNTRTQEEELTAVLPTNVPTDEELQVYVDMWSGEIFKEVADWMKYVDQKEFWHYDIPEWCINPDALAELGGLMEVHNNSFEQSMWKNVCVPQHGFYDYGVEVFRDSMGKCAAHAIPLALGNSAIALKTPILKDEDGKRTMLELSTPTKNHSTDFLEVTDAPIKFLTTYHYCVNDTQTQREISKRLYDLIPEEQELQILTDRMNQRGITCDVDLAVRCLHLIEEYSTVALEQLKVLTGGKIDSVNKTDKIKAWALENGVVLDNAQKDYLEMKHDELPDGHVVKKVLKIRLDLGKSSTKKLICMRDATDPRDNAVRYNLVMNGASTGRYAGRLLQPQNFPAPKGKFVDLDTEQAIKDVWAMNAIELIEKYDDLLGLISSLIRSMVVAPPGHDFISADYNAIEARVVLWAANATEALEMFRNGIDLYKDMASIVYNVPIEEVTKEMRQLGKAIILGCGFGMSAKKFYDTCLKNKVNITMELAEKSVHIYRKVKYPEVPSFWTETYNACRDAVITGKEIKFSHFSARYDKEADFLYIRLPCGRDLAYAYPRIKKMPNKFNPKKIDDALVFCVVGSNNQWIETTTYGGHLVENIVQAVARDCMTLGMRNVEKTGIYLNIFTVHDELVCAVKKNKGSLEEFISILEVSPSWAPDLPIKAEGWREYRYRK